MKNLDNEKEKLWKLLNNTESDYEQIFPSLNNWRKIYRIH